MYNIRFSDQNNGTNSHTSYQSLRIHAKCQIFYDEMSHPNLFGDEDLEDIMTFEAGLDMLGFLDETCFIHNCGDLHVLLFYPNLIQLHKYQGVKNFTLVARLGRNVTFHAVLCSCM